MDSGISVWDTNPHREDQAKQHLRTLTHKLLKLFRLDLSVYRYSMDISGRIRFFCYFSFCLEVYCRNWKENCITFCCYINNKSKLHVINNNSYYCMQDIKAAMGKAQYNNLNAASLTLIHSHIQMIIFKHQRPQLTALNCSSQSIHPVLSSLTLPSLFHFKGSQIW